jgi:hypothetical protein
MKTAAFHILSDCCIGASLCPVRAWADLVYQPGEGPHAWKEAAASLLKGTGEIWDGLAAFEREDRASAKALLVRSKADFARASEIYSGLSKEISRPRKLNSAKLAQIEPGLEEYVRRALQSLGFTFPDNERAAAELGASQTARFVDWLEKHNSDIEELKVRSLQELILELNKISWAGTQVAIMMHEGLD